MKKTLTSALAISALALAAAGPAAAAGCDTVTFSDVGWTDITVTTSAAKQVLTGLGYGVDVKVLSVPVTFASLEAGDIDVFLGNWMPAQEGAIKPYLDSGAIEVVGTNLEGTQYTLAVPTYLAEKGLKTYADVAKFKDELGGKIYGIEPGNEGNTYLISLTEAGGPFEGFDVVESSEQGMLAQVARYYPSQKGVVFLGWAPHPMNANFDLTYLTGGEDFFGGAGIVQTVARKGYVAECPAIGALLKNMTFSLEMENEIMGEILDGGAEPDAAVAAWIKANPSVLDGWLAGISAKDGSEGLAAVKAAMGL
ncbi:choline ABC transporter substrate-binding protein [Frigidibacter mobilis]|uniref:ABC glycine betaine/L-proline transporter, periplasmic substrate-binding subunit n=1 Tax=Frigidibacter mobilis TaxID=1335048 RepID=A0A159Z4E2_9RHOB|nr:choline ABC transporter substrate-binding protein [Frigidibacter mobilis]AMY70057.1 ABC glycine betaine/L-proline transporter, periplasmic substrate-binding subunit [Frigidibacter mobilis]